MNKLSSLNMSEPVLPTAELFGILGDSITMLGSIVEDFDAVIDFDDRKNIIDQLGLVLNLAKALHLSLKAADDVAMPWSGMPR